MAINPNRPIITYENVAVFQSDTPAHSGVSNSGQNLSILPLVQSINFSTDLERTNVGAIGTKDFIDSTNFPIFSSSLYVGIMIPILFIYKYIYNCKYIYIGNGVKKRECSIKKKYFFI